MRIISTIDLSQHSEKMAKVEIYTSHSCPYCVRAKDLLAKKHVNFTEYRVDQDDKGREKMLERTGGKRTVPQIFINDTLIGGCDDLYRLEMQGKLDGLLQ